MGRMLEALKQIEARRPTPAAPAPAPCEQLIEARAAADSPQDEDSSELFETPECTTEQSGREDISPEPVDLPHIAFDTGTPAAAEKTLEQVEQLVHTELVAEEWPEANRARPSGPGREWPESPSAEHAVAHRQLAIRLAPLMAKARVLGIVGLGPIEETSALIIGAAPELARLLGGRLLLADWQPQAVLTRLFTPANPALADHEAPQGLVDVFSGGAAWREVVCPTTHRDIDLMPWARTVGSERAVSARKAVGLLRDWREAYRGVLVQAESCEDRSGGLLGAFDGVVLAVPLRATTPRDLRRRMAWIDNAGGRLIGCVAVDG
ncbi:MAG: hypothetical protein ACOY3P_22190 [Planctomycetota bacterium]